MENKVDIITLELSPEKKQQFPDSKYPKLRKEELSDFELIKRAAAEINMDLNTFIVHAAVGRARRTMTDSRKVANIEDGVKIKGLIGGADGRLGDAFKDLSKQGIPITIKKLAALAGTNYFTAERWATAHHPDKITRRGKGGAEAPVHKPTNEVSELRASASVDDEEQGEEESESFKVG